MKKFLINILLVLLLTPIPVIANTSDTLANIENSIFGFDYSKDSNQNRISRLEKTIYGKSSNGDINKRIQKLTGDISADVIGLEIPAERDTFLAEEEKADSSVNYPIVNEIEQRLFNRTFENRDFHTRIVTIEKKLFGKIYDVDDYSTRMERIKSKAMPETIVKRNLNNFDKYNDGSYFTDKDINDMDFFNKQKNNSLFGQRNYSRPYTNYGDYTTDTISDSDLNDELSKMEYDVFGTEFPDENPDVRIKRLNSVNKAKKSSRKYDSQKFNQHLSTAMEIGAMILMILAMVL